VAAGVEAESDELLLGIAWPRGRKYVGKSGIYAD